MTERGPTWTEEYRHACEVRAVCAMPSKAARRRYLMGDAPIDRASGKHVRTRADGTPYRLPLSVLRGEQAAARLIEDVRVEWARRQAEPQLPAGVEAGAGPSVGSPATAAGDVPGSGSFLAPSNEGPLRRGGAVDSGVAA